MIRQPGLRADGGELRHRRSRSRSRRYWLGQVSISGSSAFTPALGVFVGILPFHASPSASCLSLRQRRCQRSQKQADVGDHADRLAGAAIAHLGGDRRIDIDADDLHPARQHVAGGDGVQHRAQAQHQAGALQLLGVGVLRAFMSVMVSGSGPSSRRLPASTNGMPAFTHSYMMPLVRRPLSTALAMPPA